MLPIWIEDITIDRHASKASIKVRRIPAVTPEIAEALKSMKVEGFIVSKRSARNPKDSIWNIYYRLQAGSFVDTKKLVPVKKRSAIQK